MKIAAPQVLSFDSTSPNSAHFSPSNFAIDWARFFDGGRRTPGTIAQLSYKIDASLTNSLSLLPLPVSSAGPADLAKRNLLRSVQLSMPSGQNVARSMGVRPLPDDQILVGKATGSAADALAITTVSPEFADNAPLWTYILAESVASAYRVRDGHIVGPQVRPFRLGPVGGRIVAEGTPEEIVKVRESCLKRLFAVVMQSNVNAQMRCCCNLPDFRP